MTGNRTLQNTVVSYLTNTNLACLCMLLVAGPTLGGTPPVAFEDVSDLVDFPAKSYTVGGNGQIGAAWLDYDNDGWLDLYLANGCNQNNGLFRNNGDGTFSDVSVDAGVTNGLGSNGVIAADIDNDGFQDIFLTGEGGYQGSCERPVVLYHNNGDGTFSDITESSGVVGPTTQFSAAMADIDNDGFLDLFITGSGPQNGNGPPNSLYHNNGDLTFTDISASSGVDTDRGACAAYFTDVNNDGFIDLHVANCVPFYPPNQNELFMNNGDLTFQEVAVQSGLGATGYWMGLAPGDYDNDGDIDHFVTNLGSPFGLFHALLRNNGDNTYTNVAAQAGASSGEFGWGGTMADFDNDGYADIFFAGACPSFAIGPGAGNPGTMLFNDGDGTFTNHTSDMPTNLASRSTSGVAAADYDNDGFVDIVVAADAFGADPGGPTIFRNLGNGNNWLTIKLRGTVSNRDAVGARVHVTAGGMTRTKEVYAGMSFLSQDSLWLTFGLGSSNTAEAVEVRWPRGLVETIRDVASNQAITLIEGENCGEPVLFGDVAPIFGVIDIDDILCILDGFSDIANCPEGDIVGADSVCPPFAPNGVDFDDVFAALDAFSGNPPCPDPCPQGRP